MGKPTNGVQARPNMGNVKVSSKAAQQIEDSGVAPGVTTHVDRSGDRLIQLPQASEITTLSEATLRWLRHRGEGPPFFKLHRRLVVWERDLHGWIAEQATKEAAARS